MAPVEAMSCGLPLVTFDVPTLRSLDPKGMIKIPCYDLELFAEGIVRLLNDEELYRQTQENAVAWARKWDWGERAEEILSIIRELRRKELASSK